MRNILEDIYYGRLAMYEQAFKRGSKYAEAYSLACAELASISECDAFIKGFRAGAQVMLAICQPEDSCLKPIAKKENG